MVVAADDDTPHTVQEKRWGQLRKYRADRRKNVVELTAVGSSTLRGVTAAADEAERQFLASLVEVRGRQLMACLRTVCHAQSGGRARPSRCPSGDG
jgi:hypothetical protein